MAGESTFKVLVAENTDRRHWGFIAQSWLTHSQRRTTVTMHQTVPAKKTFPLLPLTPHFAMACDSPLLNLRRDIFDRAVIQEAARAQDATSDLPHDVVEISTVPDVTLLARTLA